MAKEKRLIDADALMYSIKGYRLGKIPKGELEWKIENAPTVDAVEVVRCKNCKHYEWNEFDGCHVCIQLSKYVKEDFFCAYGERREKDAID